MGELKRLGPSAVSVVQQEIIAVSNPVQILEPS